VPTEQQLYDLSRINRMEYQGSPVWQHVKLAKGLRGLISCLDAIEGADAVEAHYRDQEARAKAVALLATFTWDTIPLLNAVEDPALEEARAFLAKVDNARRLVAGADKARARLDALWQSACDAALLLGREPPPAPIDGMVRREAGARPAPEPAPRLAAPVGRAPAQSAGDAKVTFGSLR
jgi:hypothetical protein